MGRTEVQMHKKPVVAVLSTGNELLDLQAPQAIDRDGWGRIWDMNRPSSLDCTREAQIPT
jgi:gephyrin